MSAKIAKLTPEQEARLFDFREEWRQVGVCCDPADFAAGDDVIRGFYARIGKPAPVILHFSSPAMCELALHAVRHLLGKAPDQLGDQLRDQLGGQLRDQLGGQLWDQLWDQLGDQLGGQLWDQLGDQLGGQLRDQLWDQLGDQLGGQLRDQLWDQLGDQLGGQLRDQLWDQLGDQLGGQLRDQLWDQLGDQLRDQLGGQLGDQLGGQLWDQLWDQLWGQQLSGDFYRYSFDNQWNVAWGAFYLFGHEIGVQYKPENIALLLEWGRIFKSVGWWTPFEGICFVSDRPRKIHFDGESRLHSEVGKAVEYSDGWGVHAWHGRRVPSEWIENRKTLNPAEIVKHKDVEMRAVGAAIIGWPRMLSVLKAKTIDAHANPDIGELIELTLPGLPEPGRFLKAVCPRNGIIVEGVPRVSDIDGLPIETALAAQAWRIGDPASEYTHPPVRT